MWAGKNFLSLPDRAGKTQNLMLDTAGLAGIWPLHIIWQPMDKQLNKKVEYVQRRATKMLSHLKSRTYPKRLQKLKLPSLEQRRLKGDIIETYKYLHGKI